MCKYLIDWIFCCCSCCRSDRTQSKDMAKYTKKLRKKYVKDSEAVSPLRRVKKSHYTTARYGTNWETLVNRVAMSPSQIGDSMISNDITIDANKFKDTEDIYKLVLKDYDFAAHNLLGKGAFGEVYKIKKKDSNEWHAVKIMKLKGAHDQSRHRFDMFKNEVFSLRKNPHKNIIKLINHSMVTNYFLSFLIMEFAEGGDLLHRLKDVNKRTDKGFPESEAQTYFAQMANAMNFVHSNGLIHGDLKLENILIVKTKDNKEVVKISDFGCARVAFKEDTGIVSVKRAFGTISYMAPEQLRVYITVNLNRADVLRKGSKAYNPIRSDVWSLGVCLYRMLFYDYPFVIDYKNELESIQTVLKEMKSGCLFPKEISKDLSKDSVTLIRDMLDYDKNRRIDMKIVVTHKWIHDSPHIDKTATK